MIPLRDTIPSYTYPIITIVLIVVNVLIFLYEWILGARLNLLFEHFALIPAKYFWLEQFRSSQISDRFLPFVSSMFLHGSWMHLIGNMWYLWIFGDNIEDRLGHVKFLLFYIFCGLAAGMTHVYLNADSPIPTVGASGAIAGVMGAYMFLYPRSRVLTLLPIFIFFQIIEVPAVFFLGFWVLLQFFQGTFSLMASDQSGGVAWWAHLGGFVIGAVAAIFYKRTTKEYVY